VTCPKLDSRTGWLQPFVLAGRFLFIPPSDEADHVVPSERLPEEAALLTAEEAAWIRAGKWLPAWGLLIGVSYAVVFGVCWRIFGQYQGIRWLPAVAVLVVDLGGCGFRLLAGTASLAARWDRGRPIPVAAVLAIVLIALVKFCLLVSLPIGIWQASAGGHPPAWAHFLDRFRPLPPTPIYRPLILMPLWGRYAMELTLAIGRAAPDGSRRLRRMGDGISVTSVIIHWLLCTVLTALYCSGAGRYLAHAVVMSLGVLVVVYAAGFLMAHRLGGQNEATLGTASLVGELSFLVLYIALSSAIYWY